MSEIPGLSRRTFVFGSVAIAGGVAFGRMVRRNRHFLPLSRRIR